MKSLQIFSYFFGGEESSHNTPLESICVLSSCFSFKAIHTSIDRMEIIIVSRNKGALCNAFIPPHLLGTATQPSQCLNVPSTLCLMFCFHTHKPSLSIETEIMCGKSNIWECCSCSFNRSFILSFSPFLFRPFYFSQYVVFEMDFIIMLLSY